MFDLTCQQIEDVCGAGWKMNAAIWLYDNFDSFVEGFRAGAHTENPTYGNPNEGVGLPNA